MNRRSAFAAAAALLLLAGPSSAPASGPTTAGKEPRFLLTAKAEKDTVKLGERIAITLKLTSRMVRVAAVGKIQLGSPNAVVFDVKTAKGNFQVSRLLGRYEKEEFKSDPVPREQLKGGQSITGTVNLLAILPGKMEITAVYLGIETRDWPDPIEAKPVTVTVEPGAGGETKVGAKIRTSKGEMTAELLPEKAYNTVNNFLTLGMDGYYNHRVFHRIIKDFMVQTGDPNGNGTGGPGYYIPAEFNDIKHEKGVLSMAKEEQPNTAGSQFFIVHKATPFLDGKYSAFGRVISGIEVVDALANVPVKATLHGAPSEPVEMPTLDGVDLVLLK